MSKTKILFIVGMFIVVLPYLGFPYLWKNVLFAVSGLGVAFIAYTLNREAKRENMPEKTFENFSENSNFNENGVNTEKSKLE